MEAGMDPVFTFFLCVRREIKYVKFRVFLKGHCGNVFHPILKDDDPLGSLANSAAVFFFLGGGGEVQFGEGSHARVPSKQNKKKKLDRFSSQVWGDWPKFTFEKKCPTLGAVSSFCDIFGILKKNVNFEPIKRKKWPFWPRL